MKPTRQVLTFHVATRPPEPRGAVLAAGLVMALVGLGRWATGRLANRKAAHASAPAAANLL